jgi:hypothetical protein
MPLFEHYYRGVRDVVALEQIRSCFRAINGAVVERESGIPAPWLVLEKCVWTGVWRGFVPNPTPSGPQCLINAQTGQVKYYFKCPVIRLSRT